MTYRHYPSAVTLKAPKDYLCMVHIVLSPPMVKAVPVRVSVECFPIALADTGAAWVCMASLLRGTGRREILGNFDDYARRSLDTAISFIGINAVKIKTWLLGKPSSGCHASLYNSSTDLTLMLGQLDELKSGASFSACAALSLVGLMTDISLVERAMVACTGRIDLRGRIRDIDVDSIMEKCKGAKENGVEIVVVPTNNHNELVNNDFNGWGDDLKAYGQRVLRSASTFVDLMEIAIEGKCMQTDKQIALVLKFISGPSFFLGKTITGFEQEEGMVEALDSSKVGIGRCLCLNGDGGDIFEFQCCYTGPGEAKTIITGKASQVVDECILFVKTIINNDLEAIAARCDVSVDKLRVMRPHMDLHVHCEKDSQEIGSGYAMAAIYIAMVSLLLQRRPREDTVILAEMNSYGHMFSKWVWTLDEMNHCAQNGVRRVVLGEGTHITVDAMQASESWVHEDGKPLVELVVWGQEISEALHYFFEESME